MILIHEYYVTLQAGLASLPPKTTTAADGSKQQQQHEYPGGEAALVRSYWIRMMCYATLCFSRALVSIFHESHTEAEMKNRSITNPFSGYDAAMSRIEKRLHKEDTGGHPFSSMQAKFKYIGPRVQRRLWDWCTTMMVELYANQPEILTSTSTSAC